MTAKNRELTLDDLKAVSGGVTIPTKQQIIANSANMSVSVPSGVNTAMVVAKPQPQASSVGAAQFLLIAPVR